MQAYENNPLSPNLPTSLSVDGIRQLFASTNSSQLILQIIKISQDYSENKMCQLSDGFCYVTCLLSGQARLKNIKGELQVFDVVKITKQHVIVLGLERVPALQLCDLNTIGIRLLCAIGEPVAYMTYFHNDYVNRKGSSVIADGQKVQSTINIKDLTQNYPHVPSKWILKAKVVKMPQNISQDKPFMIVRLMDDKQNVIQGVFFGQVAAEAHKKLLLNRQYLFNNGQIKTKKSSPSQFQIKFTEQSQIIPIQTMKNSTVQSTHSQSTVSQIIKISNQNPNKLVNIVGKVRRIKNLSKGRSIEITDRNSEYMQVVLWEEIQDQVMQGSTYQFQNLRIKIYRDLISLQSVRSKTVVKKLAYQLERKEFSNTNNNANNNANNNNNNNNKKSTNQSASMKLKQLREFNNLLNVSEVLDLPVRQRQYKDIRGFLVIPTAFMDTKNYFKVDCSNCSTMNAQICINPLMCRKCSSAKPSIRWNIRCHIIDEKEDIKCYMNEELCQKLLKMSSLQGFIKFNEEKQTIKRKVQEISHLQGIWRVKLNPSKDTTYYYIVDVYKNDSSALLKKAYKDLKVALKKYIAN